MLKLRPRRVGCRPAGAGAFAHNIARATRERPSLTAVRTAAHTTHAPPARTRSSSIGAASALRRLIDEDQLWSCKICARRTCAEGVKGGRRSRAVAAARGWGVCVAK